MQIECDHPSEAGQIVTEIPGVLDASLHGVRLHVCVENWELRHEIKQVLFQAGIDGYQVEKIQPSLEDVFISMVEASRAETEEGMAKVGTGE